MYIYTKIKYGSWNSDHWIKSKITRSPAYDCGTCFDFSVQEKLLVWKGKRDEKDQGIVCFVIRLNTDQHTVVQDQSVHSSFIALKKVHFVVG